VYLVALLTVIVLYCSGYRVAKTDAELITGVDELGSERDKFRLVATELDSTFTELAGF